MTGRRGHLLNNLRGREAITGRSYHRQTLVSSGKEVVLVAGHGRRVLTEREYQMQFGSNDQARHIEGNKKSSCDKTTSTDPEPRIIPKRGTEGDALSVTSNCIRLEINPGTSVFEYYVRFEPEIKYRSVRIAILSEHSSKFEGANNFDGHTLYLTTLLPCKTTTFYSVDSQFDSQIEITVIYNRQVAFRECIPLFNDVFARIMKSLNYLQHDGGHFDPTAPLFVHQHHLEAWPGYVTAVDEYEGGVMLCCSFVQRIISQNTVLDIINAELQKIQYFEDIPKEIGKLLIGAVVVTRFDNKCYRIDEVKFNMTPMSSFKIFDDEGTYFDFYKSKYNITISDKYQMMLNSFGPKHSCNNDTAYDLGFMLVPELCRLTGLRDEQRSDLSLRRALAACTCRTPKGRVEGLKKLYRDVNNTKEARTILESWGLKMGSEPEHFIGRKFEPETISFGNKEFSAGHMATFEKRANDAKMFETVEMKDWLIIYCYKDAIAAENLINSFEKHSASLGITASEPSVEIIHDDRTKIYLETIRRCVKSSTQIVVVIYPMYKRELYVAIKQICCVKNPVVSQMISARKLSNEAMNDTIVANILRKMNCKLGGIPWSIEIPLYNAMICGIDIFYDSDKNRTSAMAFVASSNSKFTRWYSKACIKNTYFDFLDGLADSLRLALAAYKDQNQCLPERIIIFRAGVRDEKLTFCSDFEVPKLKNACHLESADYNPLITFIVVQTSINKRFFADLGRCEYTNPKPGFVLDHSITGKYLYEYFLISQPVLQGTVTPTRYIVVHNESDFSSDILQKLSYKLCYMYFNYPGTVRVPACCQYANKLARLVGDIIRQLPADQLSGKLFYL